MNKKFLVCLLIIIILIAILVFKSMENDSNYNFKIYFFNAGKADSILIQNNDKYIMIDTGEESLSTDILRYYKKKNITKLDYLIITHFDKDHVGSASKIIDNIEVANVLQSNCPKESEYYDNYISSLENKNIEAQTISGNFEFTLEDLNVIVNGPDKLFTSNESNNSSLVVSINYINTNYLFMGDCQNDRIEDFLSKNSSKYDFIKIPYHGHYQKKLSDLLESVKPTYSVITSSNDEPEDEETLELLEKLNIKNYLARNGSISVLSDGNSIKIKQ